jgi:hypothetical protein
MSQAGTIHSAIDAFRQLPSRVYAALESEQRTIVLEAGPSIVSIPALVARCDDALKRVYELTAALDRGADVEAYQEAAVVWLTEAQSDVFEATPHTVEDVAALYVFTMAEPDALQNWCGFVGNSVEQIVARIRGALVALAAQRAAAAA